MKFIIKLFSCITECRLPWIIESRLPYSITHPILLFRIRLGLAIEGGGSHPTMDGDVKRQIRMIKPGTVVDFGAGQGKYGRILGIFMEKKYIFSQLKSSKKL